MEKTKRNFILSGALLGLFGLLTVLVMNFDVAPIGPKGSEIGLSAINGFFRQLIGENIIWYNITDWLGFSGIFTAFGFGLLGFIQLIKRKSILKADADIYLLGLLYIIVIGAYVLFEVKIVNYRPILMNGILEASYPSSHTMLICSVMGSAIIQFKKRIRNKMLSKVLVIFSGAVIFITISGRILSGVHWFTDILGGLLLSGGLVMLYYSVISAIKRK